VTFLFEKLDVYQRALSFADQASALTVRFPRQFWYLADQFNRASLSIALNVAEGNGRGTPLDKRRFLLIARGSAFECVPLVDMCSRKGLLPQATGLELRGILVDLSKMLSRMIEHMSSAEAVREDGADYA
jgi:four helix bundle protein